MRDERQAKDSPSKATRDIALGSEKEALASDGAAQGTG